MEWQSVGAGEGFYLLSDPPAIRMDAVIHMGDHQVPTVKVATLEQQVQKCNGVGAP